MSIVRSLPRRHLRIPAFFAVGVLGFFSMAAKGCNGVNNVSIDDGHMKDSSPAAEDSSAERPVIVTRDNPMLSGQLEIGAGTKGARLGPYGPRGKWTNLSGTVDLLAPGPAGYRVRRIQGPLFPGERDEGPDVIRWMSRVGDLVPHNKYQVTLAATEGPAGATTARQSDRPLWVQLADDVAVVPVVVISWKKAKGNHSFSVDETHDAKALFDFAPYVANYPTSFPQLPLGTIERPNVPVENIVQPDLKEMPPDEIYAPCKVQFQVVASYVFELSSDKMACDGTQPSFESVDRIRDRLRATGARGKQIADQLQPVYVSYGSFKECFSGQGYVGKKIYGQPLVEINAELAKRPRTTTAHELGHVLIGVDHFGAANDANVNLMRPMPNDGSVELTAAQCSAAYSSAKPYRDRFVDFNHWRGIARLPFSRQPPVVVDATVPDSVKAKACCSFDGKFEPMTSLSCTAGKKGKVVDDSACKVCCATDSDVESRFSDECSADETQPRSSCEPVCCSDTGPYVSRTRYSCKETGTEIQCVPQ